MLNTTTGTPVTGYISLTNASPGPTAIPLFVNGAAYTLATTERVYLTQVAFSTNDSATPLVTVDDGAASPQKVARAYVTPAFTFTESVPPGTCRTQPGKVPRATASAVTAGKTVEITITGYVSRT